MSNPQWTGMQQAQTQQHNNQVGAQQWPGISEWQYRQLQGMQQSRAWMTQEQRDYYDALAELDREFPGIDEGR